MELDDESLDQYLARPRMVRRIGKIADELGLWTIGADEEDDIDEKEDKDEKEHKKQVLVISPYFYSKQKELLQADLALHDLIKFLRIQQVKREGDTLFEHVPPNLRDRYADQLQPNDEFVTVDNPYFKLDPRLQRILNYFRSGDPIVIQTPNVQIPTVVCHLLKTIASEKIKDTRTRGFFRKLPTLGYPDPTNVFCPNDILDWYWLKNA